MRTSRINSVNAYTPAKKTAKNIAKAAICTTAAAGTLAYLSYKGKLNPTEGGNKALETAKKLLKKPADYIFNKGSEVVGKAKTFVAGNEKLSTAFADIQGFAAKVTSSAADKIEKIFNPEKFV